MPQAASRIPLGLIDGQEVAVPGPPADASLLDLLPAARALSEATSAASLARVRAAGKEISCKVGCGACCRQLVSISLVEAVGLADLVAELPPDRQAVVRGRFADAVAKLEKAGLLDPDIPATGRQLIGRPAERYEDAVRQVAADYFALGVACPFLENESCSIHPRWPSVCREYHVTTPAERCGRVFDPGVEIDRVTPDVRGGAALVKTGYRAARLPHSTVPLVLALEWAGAVGPAVRARRAGDELAQAFTASVRDLADHPAPPAAAPPEVTADITMGIQGRRVSLKVTVSTGATRPRDVLPVARAIAEIAVGIATEDVEKAGKAVSCGPGCGACCRQLVPLSEPEAQRFIADLVAGLPEPRRAAVRERFADAARRLDAGGLLPALRNTRPWTASGPQEMAVEYFALGVPCPFLEDESCSIHPDRPLICRGYLVTSPPEFCRDSHWGKVEGVELPVASPFRTFAQAAEAVPEGETVRWVPLVLAPEWAAAHPEPPPDQPGPDRLRDLFRHMTGATPPADGPGQ